MTTVSDPRDWVNEKARCLKAAHALADMGLYVFPLDHPWLDECAGAHKKCDGERGKHPEKGFVDVATVDHKKIDKMWHWVDGPRNVGIYCKASGLVVLDEDGPGEVDRAAKERGQIVPNTFTVGTGKGRHLYYWRPESMADWTKSNAEGEWGDYDVNVRDLNGYTVGPGSRHENGVAYKRIDKRKPVYMPQWSVDMIMAAKKPKDGSDENADPFATEKYTWWRDDEIIHHPHRHGALIAVAGYAREANLGWVMGQKVFREVWDRLCRDGHCESAEYVDDFDVAVESKLKYAWENWTSSKSSAPEDIQAFDETNPPVEGAVLDETGIWHIPPRGILGSFTTDPYNGDEIVYANKTTGEAYGHEIWDPAKETWADFDFWRGTPRLNVTTADQITMKATEWLWADGDLDNPFEREKVRRWIPYSELTLWVGREGTGKSSWTFKVAAEVTTGTLPGALYGESRYVVVVATEDDWEHTIVPRLAAAGADLTRVIRVEAADEYEGITLPADLKALQKVIEDYRVALVILDPLLGLLDIKLDSHKDAEIRQALVPLRTLAGRTGATVIGLAHVNKTQTGDLSTRIMGSRAMTAVPRAVMFAAEDLSEGGSSWWLGQTKSSLGKTMQSTIPYTMEEIEVGTDEHGKAITSTRIIEGEVIDKSISELVREQENPPKEKPVNRAVAWLTQVLDGVEMSRSDVLLKAAEEGHAEATVKRAFSMMDGTSRQDGRRAMWSLDPITTTDPRDPGDTTDPADPGDPGHSGPRRGSGERRK